MAAVVGSQCTECCDYVALPPMPCKRSRVSFPQAGPRFAAPLPGSGIVPQVAPFPGSATSCTAAPRPTGFPLLCLPEVGVVDVAVDAEQALEDVAHLRQTQRMCEFVQTSIVQQLTVGHEGAPGDLLAPDVKHDRRAACPPAAPMPHAAQTCHWPFSPWPQRWGGRIRRSAAGRWRGCPAAHNGRWVDGTVMRCMRMMQTQRLEAAGRRRGCPAAHNGHGWMARSCEACA